MRWLCEKEDSNDAGFENDIMCQILDIFVVILKIE